MNKKLWSSVIAATLGATLVLASPVFARGGGGHGGHGGGMHFGGHHGGGHFGGRHFGYGGGYRHFAYQNRFHHRFHRVGFYGGPFAYASYNSCWRRARTFYGLQWVNVCGGYSY